MKQILLAFTLITGFTFSAAAQTISISNPCSCRNNSTDTTNGQLDETVQVTGIAGETWTVSAVSGLYQTTSPAPPALPALIGIGDTLAEVTPGIFEISGVLIDAVPYSISVTNGSTTLSIANTCYYPNPFFTGLDHDYCNSSQTITLTEGADVTGTGVFTIGGSTGNTFDPSTFPFTANTVSLDFTSDAIDAQHPGCISTVSDTFRVHQMPALLGSPLGVCEGQPVDLNLLYGGTLGDGIVEFRSGSATGPVVPNLITAASGATYYAIDTTPYVSMCFSEIALPLTIYTATSLTQDVSLCQGQTYTIGTHTYDSSGTYLDTLINSNSCDSFVTTNLTINSPTATAFTFNVCKNQVVIVNGITYDSTGTYVDHLLNVNGCDSAIFIDLTVRPTSTTSQSFMICDGSSVTVGSNTYTTSGTFTDTLSNNVGCDSVITTTLTILPATASTQTFVVCEGTTVSAGSSTYSVTGIYSDTLTGINGCDSVVTTDLTVNPVSVTNQSFTLCQGQSVAVGGNVYSTTGVFNDTMSNGFGCDSIINTSLYIIPQSVSQTFTICDGQSVTVGIHTYTVENSYLDTLTNSLGCDSFVSTDLFVNFPSAFSQTIILCQGGSVTIGGNTHNATGIFNDTIPNNAGCDSVVTTNLTILTNDFTGLTVSICTGDTFFVGSNFHTATGIYSDTLLNSNGCDSVIGTDLTVNPPSATSQAFTICEGSSVTAGGNAYTISGTYMDTLNNMNGCDSIIMTTLNVIPKNVSQSITVCSGGTYTIGTHTYSSPGTYIDTLLNSLSCDSIVTTNLSIGTPSSSSQTLVLCQGQSVTVGIHTYTMTGTFTDTVANGSGCDSVITTNLTVNPASFTSQAFSLCQGFSVNVGIHTYDSTGTYLDTLIAANGCDSIITTNLIINYATGTAFVFNICQGQTVTVNGITYDSTGNYVDHLLNSNGCDSAIFIDLTVRPTSAVSQSFTLCEGQSITVGPNTYAASGVFMDTLPNAVGCDSVITTTLTITPASTFTQNITGCQGDSAVVGGNVYYISGSYSDTLVAGSGCDSIVTTNLTINLPTTNNLTLTICEGQSVVINGITYDSTAVYVDHTTNSNGCDSTIHLNLTVLPSTSASQSLTICQGQSIVVGSNAYFSSGIFTDTIMNGAGCDSIVTTNLTVIPSNYNQSFTICQGQSITVGSSTYSTNGTYTDSLLNMNGCDSIVTTTLNVVLFFSTTQSFTLCTGQTITVGSSTYGSSGTFTDTLAASGGCDSIITTTVIVNTPSAVSQSFTLCQGLSVTVGSVVHTTNGTFTDTLSNINGCDSVITTTLTILPTFFTGQSVTICQGQFFIVGTHAYTLANLYTDTLAGSNGCDSVVSTELNVNPPITTNQTFTVCAGQSVTVNGIVHNITGIYNDTLTGSNTCDSIVVTNLTVSPQINTNQSFTVCTGQIVSVGTHIYSTTGFYKDTLVSASNCDSIINTDLTVTNVITSSIAASICNSGTYNFNGLILNTAGIYRDTLPNSAVGGCDSIVILTLSVGQPTTSTFNAAICMGSSYSFNGASLTAPGNYFDTLANSNGCDSIITLVLAVNPRPQAGPDQQDSVCTNTTFNLNTLNIGGLSPIIFSASNPAAVGPGVYTAIYIDANTCSDTALITIVAKPTVAKPVFTQADSSFCAGTIAHFFTVQNDPSAEGYQWTYTGTDASLVFTANNAVLDFGSNATGGLLAVAAFTNNGCPPSTSVINIKVAAPPHVELLSDDADNVICVGSQITVHTQGDSVQDILVNETDNPGNSYTFTVTSDTIFDVTAIAVNACSTDTARLQVIGHALPAVDAGTDTSVAKGSWVQLEGSASGSPPFTYSWSPDSSLNYASVSNPMAMPDMATTYYLMATDMYGCMGTDSVKVAVSGSTANLMFPNIITPNGDGMNDTWKIDLDKFTGADVVIFNRWGEVVFESHGYNNDWNGTFQNNGKMLPDGTYYYALKNDMAGSTVYKGAISLLNNKK